MARGRVGGSRAVETYLRNFEGEKNRYQEILEITLCYGVQCLARTFSLKGISCNELRTITGYDAIKNRDLYVRNVSRPNAKAGGMVQRTSVGIRTKPSHSWRDGEEEMPDFPEPSGVAESRDLESSSVYDALESRYLERFVEPEAESSPTHEVQTGADAAEPVRDEKKVNASTGMTSEDLGALSPLVDGKVPRAAMGNTKPVQLEKIEIERKQHPLNVQPQQRQPRRIPRSLQHVQSKIQPELDARRKKILRVKKTQSQRMAESLARARLAEYDAKRELQDVRDRRLGPKKMPLNEITTGAAALEIADDFMKSPLMDKFGRDELTPTDGNPSAVASNKQRAAQSDPLNEELYGAIALDSSFLGCKPAPEPRRRLGSRPKQPKRNYNGWLGDFGPLHTKTVRPEWDEVENDGSPDLEPRIRGTKFEWNFEHLPGGNHEAVGSRTPDRTKTQMHVNGAKSTDRVRRNNDFDDDLSDARSDPVFEWLKDAV